MPARAKKSISFVNAALITFGAPGDDRAARRVHHAGHERRHVRDAREEDVVELLLRALLEDQVVDVRLRDLRRIARVDRAVARSLGPHLLRGVVAEHDVGVADAERLEVGPPDRRRRVDVQHARDADADLLSAARRPRRSSAGPAGGSAFSATSPSSVFCTSTSSISVPSVGNRLRRVEVTEGQPRLVVDEVRETSS